MVNMHYLLFLLIYFVLLADFTGTILNNSFTFISLRCIIKIRIYLEEAIMDFLKDNQKLRVIPKEIRGISNGTIKEVCPQYFVVELENDKSGFLKVRDIIEIIIPVDSYLVKFEAEIIELKANSVHFLIPKQFKFVQRREYTRVDINLPVKLKELDNEQEPLTSTAKNISGGGMLVMSSKNFDFGALLEARFSIFPKKDIKTLFEILRVNQSETDEGYCLAGEFKEISNADRTAIIQLCFKRQLETKCKEMSKE